MKTYIALLGGGVVLSACAVMPTTTVYYPGSINNWYAAPAQTAFQAQPQVSYQAPMAYGWNTPTQQPMAAGQMGGYPTPVLGMGQPLAPGQNTLSNPQPGGNGVAMPSSGYQMAYPVYTTQQNVRYSY